MPVAKKKKAKKKKAKKTKLFRPLPPIILSQDGWNDFLGVVHLTGYLYYKDGNC